MDELTSFLKTLISLPGLSGYEQPVRDVIANTWRPLVDEMKVSRLGSLHGIKQGIGTLPRRKILLAAHMDAIGFMVSGVLPGGFLHLTNIGGVDSRTLPGQPVTIYGSRDLPGVIVQPDDRLLPDNCAGKTMTIDDLLIDTGLLPEEVSALVHVGDIVSFAQEPLEMEDGVVVGHSLDNRASVAALTYCLEELQHIIHKWDVWMVASVQEEVNLSGAFTSPFEIKPDIAIAVDVTYAKSPGAKDYRFFDMGKGPTLGWGPVVHPALYQAFKLLAEQLDMPHQMELMSRRSGTDADAMQIVAEGIPNMVISIPIRYMHMPVEMVMMKDITRSGRLLAQFIAQLDDDFMDKLDLEKG